MNNAPISCIRLVPYKQYADGTWGSILLIGWQSDEPSAFLFNSSERKPGSPNTARNSLLDQEVKMYERYMEAEPTERDARSVYGEYGVVRLAGTLVSAHIADLVCENLNKHSEKPQRDVNRVNKLIERTRLIGQSNVLEEELRSHMADESAWVRSILEQTLPLITSGYKHEQWLRATQAAVKQPVEKESRLPRVQGASGIRAVYESAGCKTKADWGVVFKIMVEKKYIARAAYTAGAYIINQVCGEEVTTASAIKQSPALKIIGGTIARGWTDKAHNRQSSNLLIHYQTIADVFLKH